MTEELSVVKEGTMLDGQPVQPSCDVAASGYWYCLVHGGLRNNMEKAGHALFPCVLAWFCFEHNVFEVP